MNEPDHTNAPVPAPVTHRRGLLRRAWVGVALGILVVVATLSVLGASATSGDARSCSACHSMKRYIDSAAKGSHASVSCYACHASDGFAGPVAFARSLPRMVAGEFSGEGVSGAIRPVPDSGCIACHGDALARMGAFESAGLKFDHGACGAVEIGCKRCHSAVAHGASVRDSMSMSMEECVYCHREANASTDCDTCHAGRLTRERLAAGPWQVTHGPNWKNTHGAGSITYCATCHEDDFCVQCHGVAVPHPADFPSTHGEAAVRDVESCRTCHIEKAFCDECHGEVPMPHPATFLQTHAQLAGTFDNPSCLRCHDRKDCDLCHSLHVHPGGTKGPLRPKGNATGGGEQ